LHGQFRRKRVRRVYDRGGLLEYGKDKKSNAQLVVPGLGLLVTVFGGAIPREHCY